MNVLITGAGGGIGRALIKKYASEKFNVIANVHHKTEEFDRYIAELRSAYSVEIQCAEFDVCDEKAIRDVVKEFISNKTQIDVLVNNAGVAHGGLLQMTPISTVRQVFEVNYYGVVLMCQYILKIMVRQKRGVIVNVASVAGIDAEAGNTAYGASKAAVIAFTKSLAREMAINNIRVNAVAPGLVGTDMAIRMEDKAAQEMVSKSALKRLGRTEEIADAIFYLSSEKASFITGQILRVDGGM